MTRAEVVTEFANSEEFLQLTALSSASFATNVIAHPAEGQIFRLYEALFNREPDAEGFTAFTNALQSETLTIEEIAAEFVAGDEFQAASADLSNADFVELIYANALPGNTDEVGRAAFTAALDSGELSRGDVVAEFIESKEFIEVTAEPTEIFVETVFANAGDTIDGGLGNDVLFGGRSSDVFVFDTETGGADTILDFTNGVDTIDLGGVAAFDSFTEVIAAGTQDGLDAVFDFGDGNTLTLNNTSLEELVASDFGFGVTTAPAAAVESFDADVFDLEDTASEDVQVDDAFVL